MTILVIAAAVVGGAWFLLRPGAKPADDPRSESNITEAVAQRAVQPAPPVQPEPHPVSSVQAEPAPSPSASAFPAPEAPAASAAGVASNTPVAPEGSEAATPTASSADLVVVTVTTIPGDARFYHKGKPVGSSPLRVELKPGERRSFEIGRPGFHARKVVVDGKKKQMTVTMKPEG